jgi:DNA-binding CsgD family transcriptional regulator
MASSTPPPKRSFEHELNSWSKAVSTVPVVDWTEQLSILNDVEDLITTEHSLEETIAAIYLNVNLLMDAYQFAVGIYDEQENTITYKGMIENGKTIPDFSMDVSDSNRLASWCIRHEKEMFMNDLDVEYSRYVKHKPVPLAGSEPKAAIYVPLKLDNKVVGLITVRTIHKNVYQQHHLYILKTVGNFVVRTLELSKLSSKQYVNAEGTQKQWRWNQEKNLPAKSLKWLALLTEREKEVLFLLVTGLPNKAIAEKLFVSSGTVKTHTLNLYQKMDVANRTSAILKAMELGWII